MPLGVEFERRIKLSCVSLSMWSVRYVASRQVHVAFIVIGDK